MLKEAVKWPHIRYFMQLASVQLVYRTTCQFVESTRLQSRSETWSVTKMYSKMTDNWHMRISQEKTSEEWPCCFVFCQKVQKDSPQLPLLRTSNEWSLTWETPSQLWPTYWSAGQTKSLLYCPRQWWEMHHSDEQKSTRNAYITIIKNKNLVSWLNLGDIRGSQTSNISTAAVRRKGGRKRRCEGQSCLCVSAVKASPAAADEVKTSEASPSHAASPSALTAQFSSFLFNLSALPLHFFSYPLSLALPLLLFLSYCFSSSLFFFTFLSSFFLLPPPPLSLSNWALLG